MAQNLADIAPQPREVPTHKYGKVNVYGLSMAGIAHIVKNHPDIFKIMDGAGNLKMDFNAIIDLGEDVVADFLAYGLTGEYRDAEKLHKTVAMCRDMNPEDAMTIGTAILEETFPGGATNFIQKMVAKMKEANLTDQVSKLQEKAQVPESDPEEKEEKQAS